MAQVGGLNVGPNDACAIKPDGTVWCWGTPLGEWEGGSPVPQAVSGLTDVAVMDSNWQVRCAAKTDGTVWCWGVSVSPLFGPDVEVSYEDYYGYPYALYSAPEPVQNPELDHIKSVAMGYSHVCALKDDGSVWCWGDNPAGQLGSGTTESSATPVRVEGLPQARHLTATGNGTCIATVAGKVYCWGANMAGELGDGSEIPEYPEYPFPYSAQPKQVAGLENIVALTSSDYAVCATTVDGQVACWGALTGYSLNVADTATPVVIDFWAGAKNVSLGLEHACAVLADGRISCLGDYRFGETGAVPTDAATPVFVEGIDDAVMVRLGVYSSCAVDVSGVVSCWGDDSEGQLGDGTLGLGQSPVPMPIVSDDAFSAVVAGESSCGLKTNGEVSCWGGNFNGELGIDPTLQLASAVPVDFPNLGGVTSVSGGEGHFCALLDDASVSCWGDNSLGQLGDPLVTDLRSITPVQVADLTGVAQLKSSFRFSCALLDGGTVSCWGDNSAGQLGLDPVEVPFTATPTPVPDVTDAIDLVLGGYHACVRRSDASVMCWGGNYFGQFGPNTSDPALPMIVPAFEGAKALSAGTGSTCLLDVDDTVSCTSRSTTGADTDADAGADAGTPSNLVPVAGLSDVASISSSCALRQDGSIACWELGFGGTPSADGGASALTEFPELGAASQLSSDYTSCAVLSADSSIVCWGDNWNGELGRGETRWRSNPEPVAWPN